MSKVAITSKPLNLGDTVRAISVETGNKYNGVYVANTKPIDNRPTIFIINYSQGLVRCWGDNPESWTLDSHDPRTYNMRCWVNGVRIDQRLPPR